MKTIVIEAKRSEKCGICGKIYPQGTRILLDKDTRRWVMADCRWPEKKNWKKDKIWPELNNIEEQPESDPETVVSERLDIAIGILCGRFDKQPKDINLDSPVLAELLHQLGASVWLDKVR